MTKTIEPAPWHRPNQQGPLIIAEAGVNHNGDYAMVLKLISAAAAGGADVVKFQTYQTDQLVSAGAAAAPYQQESVGRPHQADFLRQYEFDEATWHRIATATRRAGLGFVSTAFDEESLDLVDSLDPVAHKIPSGEVTNLRLVEAVAKRGRPVIVSTGMATTIEIAGAIAAVGTEAPVALLHCVSAYPAPMNELNLRSIPFLHERFGLPVGWSDHTEDVRSAIAAVALGACIVERHITLDRRLPGPDHGASAEPHEFASYVEDVRTVADALGSHAKGPSATEQVNRVAARRSWHASRDLPAGHTLRRTDLVALRPEVGVSANHDIVGMRLAEAVCAGDPVHQRWLEPNPPGSQT